MCSPMFDLPEHFPIKVPVNGPVVDEIVCWCPTPGCLAWTEEIFEGLPEYS